MPIPRACADATELEVHFFSLLLRSFTCLALLSPLSFFPPSLSISCTHALIPPLICVLYTCAQRVRLNNWPNSSLALGCHRTSISPQSFKFRRTQWILFFIYLWFNSYDPISSHSERGWNTSMGNGTIFIFFYITLSEFILTFAIDWCLLLGRWALLLEQEAYERLYAPPVTWLDRSCPWWM